MTDDAWQFPPDLTADSVAEKLGGPYVDVPEGYVSRKGYLGAADQGFHRIYFDDSFQHWIMVKTEDIRARIKVPPNETDPRSVIYIRRDAKVITCQVSDVSELKEEGARLAADDGGLPRPHPPWP